MTDQRDNDLLELLRQANPVPPGATAGRRQTTDADTLFADIVQARPRRRSRRAVLIAAAIAIAILVLAALGAFFLRREAEPKQPASAACYPAASLRATPVIVGVPGDDPRPACAEQWRLGKLGRGPVPNFAVCVLRTGVQAVFPGESGSTCERLHLPPARPGPGAEGAFSFALGRLIHEQCYDESGARALVHAQLAAHGLTGWDVSVGRDRPFGPKNPCADVAINIPGRTVGIVATPDPFGPAPSG